VLQYPSRKESFTPRIPHPKKKNLNIQKKTSIYPEKRTTTKRYIHVNVCDTPKKKNKKNSERGKKETRI